MCVETLLYCFIFKELYKVENNVTKSNDKSIYSFATFTDNELVLNTY